MSTALRILGTIFHAPGRTLHHQQTSMHPSVPAPGTTPASDSWSWSPWTGLYEASTA